MTKRNNLGFETLTDKSSSIFQQYSSGIFADRVINITYHNNQMHSPCLGL